MAPGPSEPFICAASTVTYQPPHVKAFDERATTHGRTS